ncbi:MAG TPA: phenylalanine--tRNA ligase subunit beta [Ignavibacteria bacterium]|nr:phenylalanine--tRNA ligase subunit beta [Bacteroidota bacterium]HRE11830.1 phenylalanine--tRNA ligase subunit beta [Ignavibacteria bacterium]HRF66510.1 phenylalanine--tRNA ligase subunit beta [Ignavibacteria bacterium]HRJ03600.1 phenylalanine--tRNA ligase subunit beta [Ignavibacteria bacterium]
MKISLNWLRNYIDISLPVDDLVKGLIDLGIEVESVEDQQKRLDKFVIGKVIERTKHPNADKLSVCKVDAGTGEILNIVCGAPNVDTGQTVCVALVGAIVPAGQFEIKKAKLRGEVSEGMICSAKELELGDDHSGIMVLDTALPVGTPFAEYLKQNDVILEIGITPNRGDLLSHIGVARELGALTGNKLKEPELKSDFTGNDLEKKVSVDIQNTKGCLRYCGAIVEGITVKESPDWLKNYILAIGLRPINNIVDITNFVMMECGQPLHAFDYDAIAGKKIVVRSAGNDKKFRTLDNKERTLREDVLLICDGEKPVALAGIMGGENSEISNSTTNVFIESAYFDPVLTRLSSKFLGLQSDSSYRFERGVDIERTEWACKRAAQLIAEVSGGKIVNGFIDNYPVKLEKLKVPLRLSHLNRIAGISYTPERTNELLSSIGINTLSAESGTFEYEIPQSRREDLMREIDLVEEVIRLDGYDKIEIPEYSSLYLDTRDFSGKENDMLREVRKYIVGRGFKEIISNTLVEENFQKHFGEDYVKLMNPSSDKMNVLRRDLYTGLFEVIKLNFENSNTSLKLFETGNSFSLDENGKITESRCLILVMAGEFDLKSFAQKQRNFNILDMVNEAEGLFEKLSVENIKKYDYNAQNALTDYSIEYKSRNNVVCKIISFSGKFLNSIGIERPVIVCQIPY